MIDIDRRRLGIVLAAMTACISGVAVFVNGYGVRRAPDPTTYTTAKNLVAAVVLVGVTLLVPGTSPTPVTTPRRGRAWLGLAAVGAIGGSVPFVLFFEGLAQASSTDAAFIHKTLVVWVAALAVPLLHERLGPWQVLAVALLIVGQATLAGGVPGFDAGRGEALILLATLLWSVEVVVAKQLLGTFSPLVLGSARMGIGVVALLVWAVVRGELGTLLGMDAAAWGWSLTTGALLAAYVATWYAALSRAGAVDVTAVLVLAAVVTALLDRAVAGTVLPSPGGLALVSLGAAIAAIAARPAARFVPREGRA